MIEGALGAFAWVTWDLYVSHCLPSLYLIYFQIYSVFFGFVFVLPKVGPMCLVSWWNSIATVQCHMPDYLALEPHFSWDKQASSTSCCLFGVKDPFWLMLCCDNLVCKFMFFFWFKHENLCYPVLILLEVTPFI